MRVPGMLEPLRIRDFALLWTGMTASLIGDGFLLVALAWQTYELSRFPSTLGWIAAAYVAPMVGVLLGGGVLTDRFERRKLMIAADLIRVVSVGAIGALAISHVNRSLEEWKRTHGENSLREWKRRQSET